MFEVGFTEILLILGLALLVLGPEKLPGLARKIGAWTGRARAMANQLRTQLEQEVTLDDLGKSRPSAENPSTDASTSTGPAQRAQDISTAAAGVNAHSQPDARSANGNRVHDIPAFEPPDIDAAGTSAAQAAAQTHASERTGPAGEAPAGNVTTMKTAAGESPGGPGRPDSSPTKSTS